MLLLVQLFVYLSLLMASPAAHAETFYVSQNGGAVAGGSACNGQGTLSASWFNTAGNWSNPKVAGKIGPGDTVYACGKFTGTAGGTMLFFQASGSSGNVITLLFDTGATFTAPYWLNGGSGNGGAINTNGQSYLLINGGNDCGWDPVSNTTKPCNGTIVNTANGTNLPYQAATIGIDVPANSTNIRIKNVDIHNMYQRTGTSNEDGNWTAQNCIKMENSPTITNITIDHTICHDVGWGIVGGTDNIFIGPGNDFYNADHNIQSAPVHGFIFGNHFHDWGIWDNPALSYHHDGFHCYSNSNGSAQVLYIYNNLFDGNVGSTMQAFVYLEGETSSTRCFVPNAKGPYLFNNIAISNASHQSQYLPAGNSAGNTLQALFVNNMSFGNQPSSSGMYSVQFTANNNVMVRNNALGGAGILIGQKPTNVTYNGTIDYNRYENCTGYNCFSANGVSSGQFSAWQSGGNDPHGNAGFSTSNFFGVGSGCVAGSVAADCSPKSGSPLIKGGTNLYALCAGQPNPGLGALCYDIKGQPRPQTGNWDIGAFNSSSSAASSGPSAPTGLSAVVQ